MPAKGQTTNRAASLSENGQADNKNATLPASQPTYHPSFYFKKCLCRKEIPVECVVNEGVVVEETLPSIIQAPFWTFWVMSGGGIVEGNTWHNREQSHQEAESLDDSARQSQRSAITTRVLANLGLKEETENSEQMHELEPTQQLIEVLLCSDSSIRSEDIHLYLEVEFARMALLESNWQQRIVAIRTLGMLGGSDSISPLKICLQHTYEYVRAAAAQAIADIGARTDLGKWLSDTIVTLLVASFDKHWIVRTAVIQAMRTLGQHNVGRQEFINAIIFALDDEECAVRIAAVRALYGLKGKEALPRLELIAKCDFEYLVRDAAQDILQSAELQQTEVL